LTLFRSAAGIALALLLAPAGALANDPPAAPAVSAPQPADARPTQRLGRSIAIVRRQAEQIGVPPDLAQAVMMAESEGDPTRAGPTGETGLMGLRLATAMMLGFRGDPGDLFDPAVNATYGVAHLAQAWRIAGGDPCRTYVKYRTHYGEERTTGRHGEACVRLRTTLAALNSPLATQLAGPAKADEAKPAAVAQAKPAEPARPPEAKAADAAPSLSEAKPEPEATTGAIARTVAHPLPPIRPVDLAALTPAPQPRPAARAKAPVRATKAAPKTAAPKAAASNKATAKVADTKKAEPKAAATKPGSGVTLVAKTRQGAKSALTCKGKTCTLEKAASKN
jgi:hypothetical protein